MSLFTQAVKDGLARVVFHIKSVKTHIDALIGDVTLLNTSDKTSVVNSLNEVDYNLTSIRTDVIQDTQIASDTTWSSSKIEQSITNAVPTTDDPNADMVAAIDTEWNAAVAVIRE